MGQHARALRALADTVADLAAMEDGDVDDLVRGERVSPASERRFRQGLRGLGADVTL